VRRANCEAFAMGHQERLGVGSRVQLLDAGVLRMVLEQVGKVHFDVKVAKPQSANGSFSPKSKERVVEMGT